MGNYHDWSDDTFDWEGLSNAGHIIYTTLKFARIGCRPKEKFGTLRVSAMFFRGSLHELQYPGYYYCNYKYFKDFRWHLDIYFWPNFFRYTGLGKLIFWTQVPFYTLGYYIAMKRYPHLAEEICVDADFPQWIIGGQEIHDKYWTKV